MYSFATIDYMYESDGITFNPLFAGGDYNCHDSGSTWDFHICQTRTAVQQLWNKVSLGTIVWTRGNVDCLKPGGTHWSTDKDDGFYTSHIIDIRDAIETFEDSMYIFPKSAGSWSLLNDPRDGKIIVELREKINEYWDIAEKAENALIHLENTSTLIGD